MAFMHMPLAKANHMVKTEVRDVKFVPLILLWQGVNAGGVKNWSQ